MATGIHVVSSTDCPLNLLGQRLQLMFTPLQTHRARALFVFVSCVVATTLPARPAAAFLTAIHPPLPSRRGLSTPHRSRRRFRLITFVHRAGPLPRGRPSAPSLQTPARPRTSLPFPTFRPSRTSSQPCPLLLSTSLTAQSRTPPTRASYLLTPSRLQRGDVTSCPVSADPCFLSVPCATTGWRPSSPGGGLSSPMHTAVLSSEANVWAVCIWLIPPPRLHLPRPLAPVRSTPLLPIAFVFITLLLEALQSRRWWMLCGPPLLISLASP